MDEQLKPCPFCGKEARALFNHDAEGHVLTCYIECRTPGCHGSIWLQKTEQEAIEKWNTRPIEDALRKQLETAVHLKQKDKVSFDFAVLDEIATLQEKIDQLRGALEFYCPDHDLLEDD